MITIEDVKAFLNQFNIKAEVFGIVFRDDRPKKQKGIGATGSYAITA